MDLTREALTSPEAGVMLAGEDGAGGGPCLQRADRPHRSGGPRWRDKSLVPQVAHHEIMSSVSKNS
jgi:hypothetical protein